jgi:hypothetical protein
MIKDGVIADTSVLIEFLKGNEPISREVERLLKENRIITTGIIIAELLQGVKNKKEEYKILVFSEAVEILELPAITWIKAGKISSSLRRKGINLPITDVALSALATEYDLSVFTLDNHFKQIPDIKLYRSS